MQAQGTTTTLQTPTALLSLWAVCSMLKTSLSTSNPWSGHVRWFGTSETPWSRLPLLTLRRPFTQPTSLQMWKPFCSTGHGGFPGRDVPTSIQGDAPLGYPLTNPDFTRDCEMRLELAIQANVRLMWWYGCVRPGVASRVGFRFGAMMCLSVCAGVGWERRFVPGRWRRED